jgi:hypothetical protein
MRFIGTVFFVCCAALLIAAAVVNGGVLGDGEKIDDGIGQGVEAVGQKPDEWTVNVVEIRGVLATVPKIAGGGYRLVHAFRVEGYTDDDQANVFNSVGGKIGVPIGFPSDKAIKASDCESKLGKHVKLVGLQGLSGDGQVAVLAIQPLEAVDALPARLRGGEAAADEAVVPKE